MPDEIRVFVNQRALSLPAGATAYAAVAAFDPDLAARCRSGVAQVTDGRGLPVQLETPLEAGAILRAAGSARRPDSSDVPA